VVSEIRICFVCLGNIVRSPLAEHLFLRLANQKRRKHEYIVESAGTSAYHIGEKPDSRMCRVAANHGFRYSGRSRQFEVNDFHRFDYVVAMDLENRDTLQRLSIDDTHRKKIRTMREFDPLGNSHMDVPDPYFGGADGFEETYCIIERSCRGLLEAFEDGRLEI